MTRTRNAFTFTNGSSAAVTATIEESGSLNAIVVHTPNFTNAITTTITIKDVDGYTMYETAALAENDTHEGYGLDRPIDYGWTITATPSGDPGAGGGIVYVMLYIVNTVRG